MCVLDPEGAWGALPSSPALPPVPFWAPKEFLLGIVFLLGYVLRRASYSVTGFLLSLAMPAKSRLEVNCCYILLSLWYMKGDSQLGERQVPSSLLCAGQRVVFNTIPFKPGA